MVLTDRAEKNIKIKNRLLREISFNKHKELKIINNKAEVCVIYILVCTIKTVNMEGTCSSVKLVYKFCYLFTINDVALHVWDRETIPYICD